MMEFDITGFVHTQDKRQITISCNGTTLAISESRASEESDLWMVLDDGALQTVMGKDAFRYAYLTFFGVLLGELHQNNAQVPINGIRFDDVLWTLDNQVEQLDKFARDIATHTYIPGRVKA